MPEQTPVCRQATLPHLAECQPAEPHAAAALPNACWHEELVFPAAAHERLKSNERASGTPDRWEIFCLPVRHQWRNHRVAGRLAYNAQAFSFVVQFGESTTPWQHSHILPVCRLLRRGETSGCLRSRYAYSTLPTSPSYRAYFRKQKSCSESPSIREYAPPHTPPSAP